MTRKSSESDVGDPPRDGPSEVYGGMVVDIIASTPRDSDYLPAQPMELRIVRRRQPRAIDELESAEIEQLAALMAPERLETVLSPEYVVDDFPPEIEVAAVVDETGTVRFRLYGWNFGVGYLMPAQGLEVIAMGCQHDLEHWHLDQRDIFWAMDRAYLRKDHGFQQGLSFCWWRQECWDEIADEPRGSVGSEPWVRKQMAAAAKPDP